MAGRPPGAQNKDKPYRDALRMEAALAEQGEPCHAPKGSLRWIARQQLERAGEDTPAAREVADRLDGKVPQGIENGDDGAFEIIQRIERVVVKPENPNG
jgi:hypothetical protein